MATALATIGADGIDPFAVAAQRDSGGPQGTFLRFSGNDGTYTHGKDQDELEPGTRLVVNVMEMAAGWICWKDSKVVDEVNVRVVDGSPPDEEDLKDHGPYEDDDDGWAEQRIIHLADEEGKNYILKMMSKSGKRAFGTLLNDFVAGRRTQGMDKVPVIELDYTEFDAKNAKGKKIGKKFAPKFTIVGWYTEDELLELASAGEDADDYDDEPAPKALPAPAKKRAAKPAKKKEPEADEDEEEQEEVKPRRRPRKPEPQPEPEEDEDEDDQIPVEEEEEEEDEAPKPKPGGRRGRKF